MNDKERWLSHARSCLKKFGCLIETDGCHPTDAEDGTARTYLSMFCFKQDDCAITWDSKAMEGK